MNNINFSNPWLLLIGLVILGCVFIPFFIAIKKDGFNFHNITSLIIHALVGIMITLTIADMTLEFNITETDVYVLADCSYSCNRNLNLIDDSINRLSKNLPNNSKLGVITYGKDYKVVTELGDKFKTVQNSGIDDSQTNVRDALEYTASCFSDSVVKRIVVITDGVESQNKSISGLIDEYESRGIHIDAMFLDNTLTEDADEFQVSNVKYNESTFIEKNEEAVVTIESNKAVDTVNIVLTENGIVPSDHAEYKMITSLSKGTNNFSFVLDTTTSGTNEYQVTVSEYKDSEHTTSTDTNPYNNTYTFSQNVSETINILFLSNDSTNGQVELNTFKNIYSDTERYNITSYVCDDENVPFLIDDLAKYDEIVLDSFNISADDFKNNAESFVNNLNTLVSEYGKSLITYGNTSAQNSTGEDCLKTLGDMLPVNYGSKNEAKTYTILLDISNSMNQISHLSIAKTAACKLLGTLSEKDYFTVITFYGNNQILCLGRATSKNIEDAKKKIEEVEAKQATNIEGALNYAYSLLDGTTYKVKQVMLISDGLTYSNSTTNTVEYYKKLFSDQVDKNVSTSCIYINENATQGVSVTYEKIIQGLNAAGGTVTKIVTEDEANGAAFDKVIDEATEIYKSGSFSVSTNLKKHESVEGLTISKTISSFYSSTSKSSADTVLSVSSKGVSYPLYATWSYGEGVVSTYTSLLKDYSTDVKSSDSVKFIKNVATTSTPKEKTTSAYSMDVELEGNQINVTVEAQTISSKVDVYLDIVGSNYTNRIKLNANDTNYTGSFEVDKAGSYKLTLTSQNKEYVKNFTISYFDEYDSFVSSDSSFLYNLITSDGTVSEDLNLTITNDGIDIVSYKYTFAPLFMILSCILMVVDVAIRKLKLQDIKSLFKKKKVN